MSGAVAVPHLSADRKKVLVRHCLIRIWHQWEKQGFNFDGVGWYRCRVLIPAAWKGEKLILRLGQPDDGAETYFNGVSLGKTEPGS